MTIRSKIPEPALRWLGVKESGYGALFISAKRFGTLRKRTGMEKGITSTGYVLERKKWVFRQMGTRYIYRYYVWNRLIGSSPLFFDLPEEPKNPLKMPASQSMINTKTTFSPSRDGSRGSSLCYSQGVLENINR
jgi:hypothetical protein